MTPRPTRRPRPTPASRTRAPHAVPAAPPLDAPGSAPSPTPTAVDDATVQAALAARLAKRCKAVSLVTAPPGEAVDLGTMLAAGRHGTMLLEPVLDGVRLHEMSARSPTTPGGGYVVIELAPVHAPDCEALTAGVPCDCGAQVLFEGLVLSGA